MLPWSPEVFSFAKEHEVKKGDQMWENLWAHTLGPLNVPIQSEAIYEVSKSKSDSETSITASYWVCASKEPKECAQRFSHILPLHLILVHE